MHDPFIAEENDLDLEEKRLQRQLNEIQEKKRLRSAQKEASSENAEVIQVPRSPPQQVRVLTVSSPSKLKSPKRLILGIDKGKTGKDVSLGKGPRGPLPKPFHERLAEARDQERKRSDKLKTMKKNRKQSFQRKRNILEDGKSEEEKFPMKCDEIDPYSRQAIVIRYISDEVAKENIGGNQVYLIHQLLKLVRAPKFEAPEVDNYVVMGIVASNSGTRETVNGNKYCMLTLTDLKWQLECFLFGKAFERYWKIQSGTVIALLNPEVLKPKNPDIGRFSLKLDSEYDVLLEIGRSKHLGYCSSRRKSGELCKHWLDKRAGDVCEYHVDLAVQRSMSTRTEFASSTATMHEPRARREKRFRGQGFQGYFAGEKYSAIPNAVAGLYDAEDAVQTERERKERYKKQRAQAEREREILVRLSKRRCASSSSSSNSNNLSTGMPMRTLGHQYLNLQGSGVKNLHDKGNPTALSKDSEIDSSTKKPSVLASFNASIMNPKSSPPSFSNSAILGTNDAASGTPVPQDTTSTKVSPAVVFTSSPRIFSPQSLRKIGFDPTHSADASTTHSTAAGLSRSGSLKNIKFRYEFTESDDEDDLEIVP
ncbi:DNA replication licensing factor mcm10 [Schizosaccharomyces pombe]